MGGQRNVFLKSTCWERYPPEHTCFCCAVLCTPPPGENEGGGMCSLNYHFINSSQEVTEEMKKLRLRWVSDFSQVKWMVEAGFKYGFSDFKSSPTFFTLIAQQRMTFEVKGMASKVLTSMLPSSDLFWEKAKPPTQTGGRDSWTEW